MYISKSILLSVFALALTAASVAALIYMDVPFGLKADSREFHSAQPAATDDHAAWCDSPLATAQEVHDHDDHDHDGHDGHGGDGGSRSIQKGDFATNSGVIADSQFNDGGFGDIGQQWWNVNVGGHVINVHISGDGTAIVGVGEIPLGDPGDGAFVGEAPADPAPTTTTTPPAPEEPPTTTTAPPSTGDTDAGDGAGTGEAGSGSAAPDTSGD